MSFFRLRLLQDRALGLPLLRFAHQRHNVGQDAGGVLGRVSEDGVLQILQLSVRIHINIHGQTNCVF